MPAIAAAAFHLLCSANIAEAAGYGVREFSPLAMGSAYAGGVARADDPSFLPANPASAGGVSDWDAALGVIAVWPTSSANYDTARTVFATEIDGPRTQKGFVEAAYVPDLSLRYRIDEDWSVGLSVSAPWGLTTIYDVNWAGRYHAHETKLLTVDVVPGIAYQPTDDLTIAAAFQAQYATGRLSNAIDIGSIGAFFGVPGALPGQQDGYGAFDAEDWGFGYTLGLIWSPSESVRLGASYRSEVDLHMTGPVEFSLGSSTVAGQLAAIGLLQDTRGATDLTTPAVVSAGAVIELTPEWSLAGEVGFTDWSVFDELRVTFANSVQPDEVTLFRWKDSWFGSLGAVYRPSPGWSISAGTAFDQSPAGAARNARIPDADRFMIAAGLEMPVAERTALTFSAAHLFVPEEPINLSSAEPSNAFRGDLRGTTDAEATAFSVQLTFR